MKTVTQTLFTTLTALLVLAGCASKPSPNLCPTVCDGLVAYYPFYGNATDKSGNGLDGKVIGATLTKDRNGYQNHAYKFESGRFVQIPYPSGLTDHSFTFSVIVKINEPPTVSSGFKEMPILAATHQHYSIIYHFYPGESRIWATLKVPRGEATSNEQYDLTQTSSIVKDPQQYHYFAAVADQFNKTLKMYVNGEEKHTNFWHGNLASGTGAKQFTIGKQWMASMNGIIDEVRLYNRALSADEVKELYLFTSAFPPAE